MRETLGQERLKEYQDALVEVRSENEARARWVS